MSTDASNISNSPGLILRTAREELKLSIDHVAHDLHLRASVVQSMENEDYDDFSSDVFLKGYFRSYCRLVNLHEERMVELLEAQLKSRKDEIESVALNAKKAEKAKLRKKMTGVTAALALVAGLSFYVLVYLLPNEGGEQDQVVESSAPVSETSEQKDNSGSVEALEKSSDNVAVLNASSDQRLVDDEDSGKQEAVSEEVLTDDQNDAPVVSQEVTDVNANDEPAAIVPKPTNAAETLANEGRIMPSVASNEEAVATDEAFPELAEETPVTVKSSFEAVFSGDCWFKFTNGEGKTVFAALKRAGDKVSYKGVAPFSIVFGDAKQVSVTFEGQPVDLQPHTARNGRAQITLEPSN